MFDKRLRNTLVFLSLVLTLGSFAQANILGTELQSFNPVSDGGDFVTVQSAGTLLQGQLVVGGFLDEAVNNMAPALDSTNTKYSVTDHVLSSELHLGLGLLKNWEVGMNISRFLDAEVDNSALKNYYSTTSISDLRFNTKFRFLGTVDSGLALNLSADIPQVDHDYFYGQSSATSYAIELIGSKTFGQWLWGVNAGYNFRNTGTLYANGPYQTLSDEILASTALSYHFKESNWVALGELYGALPTSGTANYQVSDLTALEFLAAVKYLGVKNFQFIGGATTEIYRGTSSPDIRIFLGLNWFPCRLFGHDDDTRVEDHSQAKESLPALAVVPEPVKAAEPELAKPVEEPPVSDFITSNVNFKTGSADVPPRFMKYLGKFAAFVKAKPQGFEKITVTGYTDARGTPAFNKKLSIKRAQNVKKVLVGRYKISAKKIEVIGMGSTHPIATNETEDGRALNRRIELKVE